MSAEKQEEAARQNIKKAELASHDPRYRSSHPEGMSTHYEDQLPAEEFAFPDERKEPIHDAAHVRNAVARFDQVEESYGRRARRCLETDTGGGSGLRR